MLLIERGRAHFGELTNNDVLTLGAERLVKDRLAARGTPLPGQAEFLDLIRVVAELCPDDFDKQKTTLERVASSPILARRVGGIAGVLFPHQRFESTQSSPMILPLMILQTGDFEES